MASPIQVVKEPWNDPRLDPRQRPLLKKIAQMMAMGSTKPKRLYHFEDITRSHEELVAKANSIKAKPMLEMIESFMLQVS